MSGCQSWRIDRGPPSKFGEHRVLSVAQTAHAILVCTVSPQLLVVERYLLPGEIRVTVAGRNKGLLVITFCHVPFLIKAHCHREALPSLSSAPIAKAQTQTHAPNRLRAFMTSRTQGKRMLTLAMACMTLRSSWCSLLRACVKRASSSFIGAEQ